MDPVSLGLGALGVASSLFATSRNQSNFDSQMAFSKYQYKDMARRQDPVYQVNRLRAAGINPAFAYGQVQPGQATGSSVPSPNPVPQLDLSGLAAIGQGIQLNDAQVQNLESQSSKNVSEANLNDIDARTRYIRDLMSIHEMASRKDLNNEQKKLLKNQSDYLLKQIKFADERLEWENHNLRLEASSRQLENDYKTIRNFYLPMLNDAQLREIGSIVLMNRASASNQYAQSDLNKQNLISEIIRSGILGNDFFKGLPLGLKGKQYYDALIHHPKYRRLESAIDLLLDRANKLPVSFIAPIK